MTERYYHGTRAMVERSEVESSVTGTAGLQVVFGTAPVNLAEDPGGVVNVPVVCRSMKEAKEKLGYCDGFERYTMCASMYASFQVFKVAPVVFINVLDPKKHKKENAEKEYAVVNGMATVETEGILKDSVKVKAGEDVLEIGTDYLLSFDGKGNLLVAMVSEKAMGAGKISVASESIDPDAVTMADIIGGYDAVTGKEAGLEVVRQVYPKTGMTPGLILAPGWSHKPEVAAAMVTKCEAINGVFRAECVLDIDTEEAKKHVDVEEFKKENGYEEECAIVLWPMVEIGTYRMYYSAVYAAAAAKSDAENDDVPNRSPSNLLANVTAAVLHDGTEVFLDRQQANALNAIGVVTLVNEAGWRTWGNNTSAYPGTVTEEGRWISSRRMFTWLSNSLVRIYHEKVDSPADYRLIESICDSENIRLNSYVSEGKMAGGRIEYNEEENDVESVMEGHVIFRIYVAVYTPAEDILFILKFDPAMLEASLAGGAAA